MAGPLSKRDIEMIFRAETDGATRDINTLKKFISERGKIRARRVTGLSVQDQRKVALAVKNAREVALLPYASTAR